MAVLRFLGVLCENQLCKKKQNLFTDFAEIASLRSLRCPKKTVISFYRNYLRSLKVVIASTFLIFSLSIL